MGKSKIVEKKRKKKKGRPSLLDLQKRSLKQQQQQQQQQQQLQKLQTYKTQNPNPNTNSSSALRRSTRRNPNLDSPAAAADEDRSTGKRREKKLNLVLKLPSDDEERENSGSDSNPNDAGFSGSNLRKRKIDSISRGSGLDDGDKGEKHRAGAINQGRNEQGSKLDVGPSTPLPNKKLLLFILDRLQKKDTYGVFAEPVDPEELPDYHEVIEHPMDFGTVRKKLESGAYANLEQFEKDVFLVSSNAMQYNAPDTIYFRQARSIQELAKTNFENLRQDSDDNEPQPEPKVVRRGRPPTKNLKRPPGRPPLERANSDIPEASKGTAGGPTNRSNNELRKGPSNLEKHGSADLFARSLFSSRYSEGYVGWSADRYERTDDMTGSALKGISMKHGKKQIMLDENRRNTYKQSYALSCRQEPSVLSTFDRQRKHLIAVGLHTEYGYARSLARFAAKLGPVAWKVASKKINRCLPSGVEFGPGWVGEIEAPAEGPILKLLPAAGSQPPAPRSLPVRADSSPVPSQGITESSGDRSAEKPPGEQLPETHTPSIQPKLDDESRKTISPASAGNDATSVSSTPITPNTVVNMLNSSSGSMRSGNPLQIRQSSIIQSHVNGLNGCYRPNFAAQMGKMIGAARPTTFDFQPNPSTVTMSGTENKSPQPSSTNNNGCGEAKLSATSSTTQPSDCLPNAGPNQKGDTTPPDLNVGFPSLGSPVSGKADSVQPDLALQL